MTPGERPIFVVGFQRSGTTLLQSLIGSHPRIAAPPEMYFLFRIARLAISYGDLEDDANLRRALHDALNPPGELLTECGFDEERVLARARTKPRTMRGLFEAIMEDFAHRQGKVRWSEKSPGQTAPEIFRTFPDAQIIHIVRDPRDVIASSLRTPWTRVGTFELARRWRRFTTENVRHGALAGPDSYLQTSYEHLTRDPAQVLKLVCSFLGEEFDPLMVTDESRRQPTVVDGAAPWQERALGAIEPAVEGRWKDRLSLRDQLTITSVLGPEIAALGYEPVPRRRLLALMSTLPHHVTHRVRAYRARVRARDPRWRERMTEEFLSAQATLVGDSAERRRRTLGRPEDEAS